MLLSLEKLLRFAPSVLGLVAEGVTGIPSVGEQVRQLAERGKQLFDQGKQWYDETRRREEWAEVLKAIQITEEKLNAFDSMFILLGAKCGDLLDRVAALEARGESSADTVARAMLERPDLQTCFDALARDLTTRVAVLESEIEKLNARCGSLGAFAAELKAKQLTDTEVADFRAFRSAKQFQASGRFAESEPILLKLAQTQPRSAAVAVALAAARHDDPAGFQDELSRACRLRPDDDGLRALASAATVAVTSRRTPAVAPPVPMPVAHEPQAGDTLDGWHLEEKVGRGGWGIVFRATKKGQTRAVKVMRPDLAQRPESVEVFRDEVKHLKRLNHPNCISIEENWFCSTFRLHYIVMPLLDGVNMEQHLARYGKPTEAVARVWLTGLLSGLGHSHDRSVTHRDVKPHNVVILADGTPVLIDYGISGFTNVPEQTQTIGLSRSTAAPEVQRLGEADERTDLYMAAATMFHAFQYDRPLAERIAEEYEPALVPEAFRRALTAALSPKRANRPASAGEMLALLTAEAARVDAERAEAERARREEEEVAQRAAEKARRKKEDEEKAAQRAAEQARREAEAVRRAAAREKWEHFLEELRVGFAIVFPMLTAGSVFGWICAGDPWRVVMYTILVPLLCAGLGAIAAIIQFLVDAVRRANDPEAAETSATMGVLVSLFALLLVIGFAGQLHQGGVLFDWRGMAPTEVWVSLVLVPIVIGGFAALSWFLPPVALLIGVGLNVLCAWQFGTFTGDSVAVESTQPWMRFRPLSDLRLAPDGTPVPALGQHAVVELSPDGSRTLNYSRRGHQAIQVKERTSGRLLHQLDEQPTAAFFLTNTLILTLEDEGKKLKVHDLDTRQIPATYSLALASALSDPIPSNGSWSVWACGWRRVTRNGKEQEQSTVLRLTVTPKSISVAESRTLNEVALGGGSSQLRHTPDGQYLIEHRRDYPRSERSSPNADCVDIFKLSDFSVCFTSRSLPHEYQSYGSSLSVAKPSNSRSLLLGTHPGDIVEYNLDSKQITRTYSGHKGPVTGIELTPDGKGFVSASRDATIRRWEFAPPP